MDSEAARLVTMRPRSRPVDETLSHDRRHGWRLKMHDRTAAGSLVLLLLIAAPIHQAGAADPPFTSRERQQRHDRLDRQIERLNEAVARNPDEVQAYSQRGDALFFRGHFQKAVADYEKMVELDPRLDASHWRRGIAYFYAKRYKDAARQFEIYHTYDDVDRENGIWRYLSQVKAYDKQRAREGLLRYRKDDREPFPAVYRLFAGKTTPGEILKQIRAADIDEDERQKRLFYAQLYIGLNATVEDDFDVAQTHLREAVANRWGRKAAGGPGYMWQVGRLQYDLLSASDGNRPPVQNDGTRSQPGDN